MAELGKCPKCGGEMPPDAVEGLCARCMARVVFGGQRAEVGGQKSEDPARAGLKLRRSK